MNIWSFRYGCFCLGLILLLCGCVNFEPKPDPTRHFALGPSAELAISVEDGKPLYIQRPDLPAYAMGNRFVIRNEAGEIQSLGGVRWAEAMSEGLARALGEWITHSSGRKVSGYYPWPALERDALSVKIQFLQLLATQRGDVLVTADWRVSEDGRILAEGRYQSDGIAWSPGDAASMVAGLNQALEEIAETVVGGL